VSENVTRKCSDVNKGNGKSGNGANGAAAAAAAEGCLRRHLRQLR